MKNTGTPMAFKTRRAMLRRALKRGLSNEVIAAIHEGDPQRMPTKAYVYGGHPTKG